jgi:hypothetical protein
VEVSTIGLEGTKQHWFSLAGPATYSLITDYIFMSACMYIYCDVMKGAKAREAEGDLTVVNW